MVLHAKPKNSRRLHALRLNAAVVVTSIVGSLVSAGDTSGEVSLRSALETYSTLEHLRIPPPDGARLLRFSTADPNGGGDDSGNFVRVDGREKVLMDVQGPGVLTRLWTDQPRGIVRFYFDGSTEPQFETDWQKFAWSPVDPFAPPFHQVPAGGGLLVTFPMPFAEGLKITVAGRTWSAWQTDCYSLPAEASVQTWNPALAPDRDTARLFTKLLDTLDYREDFSNGLKFDPVIEAAPLAPGARQTWKADKDLLVVELRAFLSATESGDDIWITLPGVDGLPQVAPLSLVMGAAPRTQHTAGILFGRLTDPVKPHQLYSRIPFTIRPGEEVALENRGKTETLAGLAAAATTGEPAGPRIALSLAAPSDGGGWEATLAAADGIGRLLAVNGFHESDMDSTAMGADETITIDGGAPVFTGTSIKDFYEVAIWPEPPTDPTQRRKEPRGTTTLPGAAIPDRGNDKGLRGTHAFLPWGVPFNDQLDFQIEQPSCNAQILLIGQVFEGIPNTTPYPNPTPAPPLRLGGFHLPDMGQDSDASTSVRLDRSGESLSDVKLELFVPHGWGGRLTSGSMQGRNIQLEESTDPVEFHVDVHAPAGAPPGPANILLQATATGGDGTPLSPEQRIARINVTSPGGETAAQWTMNNLTPVEGDWTTASNREVFHGRSAGARARVSFLLPEGFEPRPGDTVTMQSSASNEVRCGEVEITLRFDGIGPIPNARFYPEALRKLLPEDGSVKVNVESREEPGSIVFDVGRHYSWLDAKPRHLELEFACGAGGEVEISSVVLQRAAARSAAIGQTRLVALADTQMRGFNFPKAKRILAGGELIRALSVAVGSGSEGLDLGGWAEAHLANLEHNAFGPRLASKPYVPFVSFRAVTVAEFLAQANGSRLQVKHASLVGARRIGIRFGYSPAAAEVGVLDPAGQLLARVNLFCAEPVVPGAYTEITLPAPNPTDTLFIEVLDSPPGSLGRHVPIERIAVFE